MVSSGATKLLGSFAPILFAPRGFKVANFNMGFFFKMVVETWTFFLKMQDIIVIKKVNHDIFLGHMVWPPFWISRTLPDLRPHASLNVISSADFCYKWIKFSLDVVETFPYKGICSEFKNSFKFCNGKASKMQNSWFFQFSKGHNSWRKPSIGDLITVPNTAILGHCNQWKKYICHRWL